MKTEDNREKRVHDIKKQKDTEAAGSSTSDLSLTYDVQTGFLTDETTGRRYRLTPIHWLHLHQHKQNCITNEICYFH